LAIDLVVAISYLKPINIPFLNMQMIVTSLFLPQYHYH